MTRPATELAELHDLIGGLRRCVNSLKARYGDSPAMRRIAIDADRILSDIQLLDTDVAELDLDQDGRRQLLLHSARPFNWRGNNYLLLVSSRIETDGLIAEINEFALRLCFGRPSKRSANSRLQFTHAERFRYVIIGACVQRLDLAALLSTNRKYDYGHS